MTKIANRVGNEIAKMNGLWDYDPLSVPPIPSLGAEEHEAFKQMFSRALGAKMVTQAEYDLYISILSETGEEFDERPLPERAAFTICAHNLFLQMKIEIIMDNIMRDIVGDGAVEEGHSDE